MSKLGVSLVQMCSGPDIRENLATIERLLEDQLPDATGLLMLPECFAGIGGSIKELGRRHDEVRCWLSELSKKHRVWLVGGSHPVTDDVDGRSSPACFVYDPQGFEFSRYNKIHLFDCDVDDNTSRYRESDDFIAGTEVVSVDINEAILGLSICYDLRFPELYRQLTEAGANILCVPSAFTHVTGKAHWELLLRARAIENQCYVLAANQCGVHPNGRETWGHSMIVSPWGDVLASAGDESAIVSAKLDLTMVEKIRSQIPCLKHRKF